MILEKLGARHAFQTFDDRPVKDSALITSAHGTLEQHKSNLRAVNKNGAGVFFTVNETPTRSRKATDIKRVRALFIDLDTVDETRTFDHYPLEPSCIVESSPGKHHVYWFVEGDVPLCAFTRCQTVLINAYDSDPKIKDLSRVMRVPGFFNNKNTPFMVREVGGTGEAYPASELLKWIDSMPQPAKEPPSPTPPVEIPQGVRGQVDAVLWRLSQAGEGERNNALNTCAFHLFGLAKAGRVDKMDVFHRMEDIAVSIGLSRSEAVTTMKSAWKGAKPVVDDLSLLPTYEASAVPDMPAGVQLVPMADYEPRNPDWLWPGWLCRGKLHILAGSPSTGKTTLFLKLAAIISSGGQWPDGTYARPQNVVMWSGEDDPEDVLRPRLERAGADLSKVFIPPRIRIDGRNRFFDPSTDIPALHIEMLKMGNIGLLGIDPIMSAIQGDGHKNTEVRRSLQPLVSLAAHVRCPVVGIAHFTKGTKGQDIVERVSGSGAIGQLTRIVLATSHDPETDTRTVVRAKSNLGENGGGYNYTIEYGPLPNHPDLHNTSVVFGASVDGTAAEIIHKAESSAEEKSALDEAVEFLAEYLVDGPRTAKAVNSESKRLGISAMTLKRAKWSLGVASKRDSFGGWEWAITEGGKTNKKR